MTNKNPTQQQTFQLLNGACTSKWREALRPSRRVHKFTGSEVPVESNFIHSQAWEGKERLGLTGPLTSFVTLVRL